MLTELLLNISFVVSALLRAGVLFFACPKKSNQKKRHPHAAPYGYPALLVEPGAAQLALCSALTALKHVLAMIPVRLRCSVRHNGFKITTY